jgi:hypothetical protein
MRAAEVQTVKVTVGGAVGVESGRRMGPRRRRPRFWWACRAGAGTYTGPFHRAASPHVIIATVLVIGVSAK